MALGLDPSEVAVRDQMAGGRYHFCIQEEFLFEKFNLKLSYLAAWPMILDFRLQTICFLNILVFEDLLKMKRNLAYYLSMSEKQLVDQYEVERRGKASQMLDVS